MNLKRTFSPFRTLMLIVVVGCLTIACQDDEFTEVAHQAQTEITASVPEPELGSLTVIGENTEFTTGVDCKTCTFVIDEKTTIVDGETLGLKAGSILCLKSGVRYGDLTFINLNGTAEKPIIISQDTKFPI